MNATRVAPISLAALLLLQGKGPPVPVTPVPVTDFAPLVLDVEGNGLQLSAVPDGVQFDRHADGHPVRVGWTRTDSDDVFLAEDVTQDGRIETGVELLCGQTAGANGFESLRRFDEDGNGVLDDRDSAFRERLILWRDTNHNGLSESEELFTPASLGVVSLTLAYTEEAIDVAGNHVVLKGSARVRNGAGVPVARTVYAVAFDSVQSGH